MAKKKLPRSIKTYIRRQKARLRREILDSEEQQKLTKELYRKFRTTKT